ncbi:MAG: hypothetical protein ACM3PF_10180 [Bacteroidota bacterium]
MIVYGDPSRLEALERCVEILNLMLEQAEEAEPSPSRFRGLLERAGELEQALFDHPEALGPDRIAQARGLAAVRRATSLAATAFERALEGSLTDARVAVRGARTALGPLRGRRASVRIKVPEGFAFYRLYLQGFRNAAILWADDHESAAGRDVLVVGIRSIGTTLSAVVASALRSRGFRVRRATVRPTGHPFERRLEGTRFPRASFGLVVDEGPGLSGSSLLCAAEAMHRAGVGEVAIVPAHAHGPGGRPGGETRGRWSRFACYPADATEVRFRGRGLPDELWAGLRPVITGKLERVADVGGGAWRAFHYTGMSAWPAVCRALERPKLLCAARDGRRVLFKFCGFATAPGLERTLASMVARRGAPLAALGFAPRLLGEAHGFVAWEWVEGRPLGAQDASFPVLERLGAYVAHAAGPALTTTRADGARARLETMLLSNARECLGEDGAAAAVSELRRIPAAAGTPSAGDGHMAPHEWIRSRSGAIVKTDIGGHDVDHTWTGEQPVHWDLAGALEEWDLRGAQAEALIRGYEEAGGHTVEPATLRAYRAAYAAHRAGQAAFFAPLESDAMERDRLERDFERWREQLVRAFAGEPSGSLR